MNEDEPVKFTAECDTDNNNIDGTCGCRRSMTGMITGKATTTFKVIEMEMIGEELLKLIRKSYERQGWLKYLTDAVIEDVQVLCIKQSFLVQMREC